MTAVGLAAAAAAAAPATAPREAAAGHAARWRLALEQAQRDAAGAGRGAVHHGSEDRPAGEAQDSAVTPGLRTAVPAPSGPGGALRSGPVPQGPAAQGLTAAPALPPTAVAQPQPAPPAVSPAAAVMTAAGPVQPVPVPVAGTPAAPVANAEATPPAALWAALRAMQQECAASVATACVRGAEVTAAVRDGRLGAEDARALRRVLERQLAGQGLQLGELRVNGHVVGEPRHGS